MSKKNTKRALVSSVLALVLCLSMLIGTTFAWFTDSVTSGVNKIIAGNLDVEVYNGDGDSIEELETLFNDVTEWEPGAVAYENLTVVNEGTLALKYQMSVNFENEVIVDGHGLSEALQVAVVPGGVTETDRDKLVDSITDWQELASFIESGKLENQGDSDTYGIVIYWEPTDNDNWFNMNNENQNKELSIDLGIELVATQLMYEEDSFGKDYDANAILPWDGSVDTEWYNADANEYVLYTAEELAGFASMVNNGTGFSGKTVKLGADIDLAGREWTPIGQTGGYYAKTYFQGTFDGAGHTISNMSITETNEGGNYAAGFFGFIDAGSAVIKNVTFEKATVYGHHWVGVAVGYLTGEISGVTVDHATVMATHANDDADGDKVGGLIGQLNQGSVVNNVVMNSTISGNRDVGGLAGVINVGHTATDNTVKDTTVVYATEKAYASAGKVVSGRLDSNGFVLDPSNAATNVTIVKSASVSTTEELKAALGADSDKIVIVLENDIAIDIGTGWNMGGAETESITITGATADTVLTLSSTYRSYFNLANPEGVLYLNNLVLTNQHEGTHFFNYSTHFNCDLVATNVNFVKAPLVSGSTAVFNNCSYNQPFDNGYGLWIMSGSDVTVNGGTVNSARGIKITDEDSAEAATTLTVSGTKFNTTAKAAILVTTAYGAEITVDNVDISNCAADSVNAVWVDEAREDYYDSVTVNGCTKFSEADLVDSNDELAAAVAAGETTIYLANGEYELKGNQADGLTIIGLGNNVKLSNLTNFAGNGNLGAIWRNINFENVTFTEKVYTMADGAQSSFKNCTFLQGFRQGYSRGVTFTGCTFYANSEGFAMHFEKVYTTVTVTDCDFVEGTIAFGDNGDGLVTFNNCTFSGETTRTEYFDAWASCELNDCVFAEGTEIWHEQWENGETVTLNNTTGATVIQK